MRIWVFLGLLAVGCKGESTVKQWCSDRVDGAEDSVSEPTWHEHIEPLVRKKCQGCHTPGGLAPLDLTRPGSFESARSSIRAAVESRRMPPFLAADCCADYLGDRSLTPEEVQRLTRFLDRGLPEGDPARAPPRRVRPTTRLRLQRRAGPVSRRDPPRRFDGRWRSPAIDRTGVKGASNSW